MSRPTDGLVVSVSASILVGLSRVGLYIRSFKDLANW